MDLENNTVLITGGGSGIGLALAKEFLEYGSKVIICGRNSEKLKAVRMDNPGIDIFECDITKAEDRQSLLSYIRKNHPNLNILINNAGVQFSMDFTEDSDRRKLIEEEVNTNLIAHLLLVDGFLPLLLKMQNSAIVNVTSALAVVPKQSAPVYCATKAALHIFTKSLRYQLEKTSVKVFEIVPALVDTDMTKGRQKEKISPRALAKEALTGIRLNRYEIHIGKTKLLFQVNRFAPSIIGGILRNS